MARRIASLLLVPVGVLFELSTENETASKDSVKVA